MPIVFANPLQPLIDVLEQVLLFFHDQIGVGWGLAIILLTVTVRLLLLPLTLKQVTSMQRLQVLAPEMKAIQAKYRDDKQRQQQEMMKFYKENRVNPLASCLPLLFQLPFFIGLYYMLRSDLKVDMCPGIEGFAQARGTSVSDLTCSQFGDSAYAAAHHISVADPSFFFIQDLTAKATGTVLVALIVLYVASQLGSGLLSSASMDRNQRMLMLGLPIVFVAFIINFPAGLLVYWITTNLWTIVQQLIVRKTVGVPRRPELATAGAPAGAASLTRGLRKGSAKDADTAAATAGKASAGGNGARATGPPPSRRKKKRTGRRR
jgi:YidC/Oxa1 family membrane protein insertase